MPYPQAAIGVVRGELATHAARSLVLSNRLIDGREALRLGLFDEALAPEAVLPRTVEVASEMVAFPVDVYAAAKCELRNGTLGALKAAVKPNHCLRAG